MSNRSDKTIVVRVESVRHHPIYRKAVRIRRKLLAHDAENECDVGDVVEIMTSRPYSRRKSWRLTQIVNRATLTEEEQEAIAIASEEAARAAEVVPIEEVAPAEGDEATDETEASADAELGDDVEAAEVAETPLEVEAESDVEADTVEEAEADAPGEVEEEAETEPDKDDSEIESGQEDDSTAKPS